jgi:hypothetical protein
VRDPEIPTELPPGGFLLEYASVGAGALALHVAFADERGARAIVRAGEPLQELEALRIIEERELRLEVLHVHECERRRGSGVALHECGCRH